PKGGSLVHARQSGPLRVRYCAPYVHLIENNRELVTCPRNQCREKLRSCAGPVASLVTIWSNGSSARVFGCEGPISSSHGSVRRRPMTSWSAPFVIHPSCAM